MKRVIVSALKKSFKNTIGLIRDTITNTDDQKWRQGYTVFQVPAKVAYHNIECLDAYFRPEGMEEFQCGQRFGKPWWELSNEEQPTQAELMTYLDELTVRIFDHFDTLDDEMLYQPFPNNPEWTRIEQYLYALRHTDHHQGSLAALADCLGIPSADWDKWV
jgi:uncharacterized damage-inducible protein DinB